MRAKSRVVLARKSLSLPFLTRIVCAPLAIPNTAGMDIEENSYLLAQVSEKLDNLEHSLVLSKAAHSVRAKLCSHVPR